MVDDGKIDPSSPFYLGVGDQPDNLITHVLLKGENYLACSRAITLSLKSRRKFGFVDGTISKSADKNKLLDWETVNFMLVSWILRAIDFKLAASIPYFEEAMKLWDYLEQWFCVASGPRLQKLRASITGCKQLKNMSAEDYYTTLMGYFDDLLRLKPPHGCECGHCTCNVAAKYELDREEDKLHQFLIGIDDDKYVVVRTNLLSQQPPTTLDRAYQAFFQEERSRGITQGHAQLEKVEAHVFALSSDRRPSQSTTRVGGYIDKSKLYFSHFKRFGHDNSGCFILHGYPPGWLEKYGKKGGASSSGQQDAPSVPNRSAAASSSPATAVTAVSDHSKPTARANVVGVFLAAATSLPLQETLSALSELQPEHVRLLLTMVNNRQYDKMTGEYFSLSWIINTGVSHHVTGDESCFMDVQFISPCPVGLPDGVKPLLRRKGPTLGEPIGGNEWIDGLYYFRRIPKVCAVTNPKVSAFELWHRRMAKQTRDSFPSSDSRASRIFEMIHCDLWGSYKTSSTCGAHYFLTIVDDFSRVVWVYLLNNKTKVYFSFCFFFAMVKCQFDAHVKCVRSNDGREFKHMLPYFNENGILFQTSCVSTPQQNGRVERKHQNILNVSRALMFQGNLPIDFWGECVLGAVYLINHTPSHLLANKTPYEIRFSKEPNFGELRVFGCLCFAHNQKEKGDKFASRSRKCVYVGYPHGKKGWKVYDLETGDIFVSRDVKFYENEFPYVHKSDSTSANVSTEGMTNNNVGVDHDFLDDLEHILEVSEDCLMPENPPSPPIHAADLTAIAAPQGRLHRSLPAATATPQGNIHRSPPAVAALSHSPPAAL
ncbi:uncharacterized protein LOC110720688 [Chenopodium quinoa]|uniref:uncharacterized protein LOC110720688 n=1 Tax=Chenopodium quinoa TaxID=63459 RepID=UPI000B775411|nr:uncharacterized protein LOC110720688 [Chenopodium quinoa]